MTNFLFHFQRGGHTSSTLLNSCSFQRYRPQLPVQQAVAHQIPSKSYPENTCSKGLHSIFHDEDNDHSLFQALLYRCPEGYLFSSSVLRCKKEEDVSCIDTPETRNVNVIQLTENNLEAFFNKWSQIQGVFCMFQEHFYTCHSTKQLP